MAADRSPRFSMRTARALTGVTDRTSRVLAAAGWLPRTDLAAEDVLALRALAAAEALPALAEPNMAAHRAQDIQAHCARAWADPSPAGWTVIVLPAEAKLATDTERLIAIAQLHATETKLLLPVGVWVDELRAVIR